MRVCVCVCVCVEAARLATTADARHPWRPTPASGRRLQHQHQPTNFYDDRKCADRGNRYPLGFEYLIRGIGYTGWWWVVGGGG